MYFLKLENSLQYIEIENRYTNKACNLLVDSGAQLNIIKKNQISSNIILENKKIHSSGITDKTIETLGLIKININGINIDFHVAPQNFCLPYDGILGIKILTEQKLKLDESYLQINKNKIKLKPAQKLIHNLNIITENAQKTDKKIKPIITIEQKEFLRKMLQNTDETKNFKPVIHKDIQQEMQLNEQIENFQIEEEVGKSSCLISYEPELISKNEVNIISEIKF